MTWQRVEGITVGADLIEGLEAQIADPLWLIGRQWQVGELTGEDAGSPLVLEAQIVHTPISRLHPGTPGDGSAVVTRRADGLPLEAMVEGEPVRDGPAAARVAAEAGLQLERVLIEAEAPAELIDQLRAMFPLELPVNDGLDPIGRAELALLARRSLDAPRIYEAVRSRTGGLPGADMPNVRSALAEWAAWYTERFSEPAPNQAAWDPSRMEYRFQIAAGVGGTREVQLEAAEYAGGRLDWHAFNVADGGVPLGASGEELQRNVRVLPTSISYAGQAASRFWQVELDAVWFGGIEAAPEDLARVAVAAFGTVGGDNWFLVPCRLTAGVLTRARRVELLDTFGERHTIRSCAELDGPGRSWRFFELSGDRSADGTSVSDRTCPWLLLSPASPGVVESAAIEDVVLRRDEHANLAWAIEARIETQSGRVIDRAAQARANAAPPATPSDDAWLYRLATTVPEHQIPLVPVRSTRDSGLYLQRGRLATAASDGVTTRGALGQILEPGEALLVHDDEVPATGIRLTRSWQLARTSAGGLVLWVGRRKRPASPTRIPGLSFDDVVTARGVGPTR